MGIGGLLNIELGDGQGLMIESSYRIAGRMGQHLRRVDIFFAEGNGIVFTDHQVLPESAGHVGSQHEEKAAIAEGNPVMMIETDGCNPLPIDKAAVFGSQILKHISIGIAFDTRMLVRNGFISNLNAIAFISADGVPLRGKQNRF